MLIRALLSFFISFLLLATLRILSIALLLEPHYSKMLHSGAMIAPKQIFGIIPLPYLADGFLALLITVAVFALQKVPGWLLFCGAGLSILIAHAGQVTWGLVPPFVMFVWSAKTVFGVMVIAALVEKCSGPDVLGLDEKEVDG